MASWGGMWLAGRHVTSWEACGYIAGRHVASWEACG